jgi:hypothetical protein
MIRRMTVIVQPLHESVSGTSGIVDKRTVAGHLVAQIILSRPENSHPETVVDEIVAVRVCEVGAACHRTCLHSLLFCPI